MSLTEAMDSFAAKSPDAEAESGPRSPLRSRRARARRRIRRVIRFLEDPFLFPMLVFIALVALLYLVTVGRR